MPDLTTTYLGLKLKNPLVASASPLSKKVDTVRRLEDAGAAAVVMYSLFEEQITHESHELDHFLERGTHSYAEALSYFPDLGSYNLGPEPYLEHLLRVKDAVDIPVIGSLNGMSTGGWVQYAQKIEQAGVDALELNIYYLPVDPDLSSAELEDEYVNLVRDVRATVKIPIALKLSPFFTALPHVAKRFVEAGANGLVLFNRFYQPDFDLEELEVTPNLMLSSPHELFLRLHWIAVLYGSINADLALTGGVHSATGVVKAMMAGAKVAMMTSALLMLGISHLETLTNELLIWMNEHEYDSIRQMQGSMSRNAAPQPAAFERVNYMKMLGSYSVR
jgi:dihydroorotate dehydrogenase (fumarate)